MKNIIKTAVKDFQTILTGTRGEFAPLRHKTAMVINNQIPQNACDVIKSRIDSIADDPDHPRVWKDSHESDLRILSFERDIPEFLEFFNIKQNIQNIDEYLNTDTKSWFLMANRVFPKVGNLGSGGGLHRDSPFSHQVKCIWYISDVNSDNGPFEYLAGSHFSAIRMRDKYPLGQSRFDSTHAPMTEVLAPAGSLLVCDTKSIHRGKPIKTGVRYAVTLYTYTSIEKGTEVFQELGINTSSPSVM